MFDSHVVHKRLERGRRLLALGAISFRHFVLRLKQRLHLTVVVTVDGVGVQLDQGHECFITFRTPRRKIHQNIGKDRTKKLDRLLTINLFLAIKTVVISGTSALTLRFC